MSALPKSEQLALGAGFEPQRPAAPPGPATAGEALAEVAVARPLRQTYTYRVPEHLAASLAPGARLVVPFGAGKSIGIYLGPASSAPSQGAKPILEVLDPQPAFTPDLLTLIRWAADYYRHPLGEALKAALPPGLSEMRAPPASRPDRMTWVELTPAPQQSPPRGPLMRAVLSYLEACGRTELAELSSAVPGAADAVRRLEARGLVRVTEQDRGAGDADGSALSSPPPERLTPEQAAAVRTISEATQGGGFAPFLLHGVTGSGKTEVYLRAIADALERGRGALCLVPEIGLTPQLVGRFRGRFGSAVALLHSGLRDAERLSEWRRLRSGEARVAVGVRSAIFAPVAELGLIVVDEEHDPSFKQEDYLRYHARDLAVMRARQLGCAVILGSATPSLETLTNARSGRYQLLSLPRRIDDRPLPTVEIVDLRLGEARPGGAAGSAPAILSPQLSSALATVLERGEQAILFLNRRGHSTFVTCSVCGFTVRCPNCSISLTHHLRRGLLCHYCNYAQPIPRHCPECRGELLRLGLGTEKVEEEVGRCFPGARILRLDRDSASDAVALTQALAQFARGNANVMVGTQMVAKGHDFPGVTLVGVILADTALAIPDFRAAERTFQVLAQVAGRAGRGRQPGRVVVQTFNPDSDAVSKVVGHDFEAFSASELRRREALGFPPFSRLVAVRFDGLHEQRTWEVARQTAQLAERAIRAQRSALRVLGPAPAPIPRLRGRSRFQLLIKGPGRGALESVLQAMGRAVEPPPAGVRVAFDVDPVSML